MLDILDQLTFMVPIAIVAYTLAWGWNAKSILWIPVEFIAVILIILFPITFGASIGLARYHPVLKIAAYFS